MSTSALIELAAVSRRAHCQVGGLSERETEALCSRINAARLKAGMSTNQFLSMDRAALHTFCRRHNLQRAEVRLAQRLVDTVRAMARTAAVSAYVTRARGKSAGASYQ